MARINTLWHRQRYAPMESLQRFHSALRFQVKGLRDSAHLRDALISEEQREVSAELRLLAAGHGNLEALAKELADLLYVTYGTAETFGIPLEDVFRAVHDSNMSKFEGTDGGIYREDGKLLKGPNYRPADVHGALTGEFI